MEGTHLKRISSVLVAFAVALVLALGVASPALAVDFGGGVGDGGGGSSNPGGGDGSSTGGSTGGGGATTNPIRPVVTYYTYRGQVSDCGANAIGWTNRFASTTEHFASSADLKAFINNWQSVSSFPDYITWLRYGCIYPPNYTDRTYKVIVGAEMSIEMTQPSSKVLKTVNASTRWGDGERSIAAAKASDEAHVNASVNISEFGRFRLSGTARAQYVTIREYDSHTDRFGGTYTDSIISTSPVFNSAVANARGQLDCERGWSDAWVGNPSFSADDCGPTSNTNTPEWRCVAEGDQPAVSINTIPTTRAYLPRSGDLVPVSFDLVTPQGNFTPNGTVTTMFYRAGGTPWDENDVRTPSEAMFALVESPEKTQQLFTSDQFTRRLPGAVDRIFARAWWASEEGSPTRFRANWVYAGTMEVQSVTVTGVNADGTWETSTTTRDVPTTAMCASPFAELTYVRAVAGG